MKKNILILIILSIILLGVSFLAVYTTKKNKAKLEDNVTRNKLFELNEMDTYKYNLSFDNQNISVEKINNVWNIMTPTNYVADQMEAFANVKNFNTLMISTVITNLSEIESFGLNEPQYTFNVWDKDKEHIIYVGNKTIDGDFYYVKYNDEYFSLDYIFIEALKKNVDMLREKDFFKIRSEEVVNVLVHGNMYTNEITRKDGTNWVFVGLETETDILKAYQDFEVLSTIKATGFVEDDTNYQRYGLSNAQTKIILSLEDSSKRVYYLSNIGEIIYVLPESINKIYITDYPVYNAATRGNTYYVKPLETITNTNTN